MNKIYTVVLAAFLALGFLACEEDACERLHIDTEMVGIPTVMKGSFPVGELHPAIGDSIVFAPQLLDTTGVRYSWMLNGKEVSTDSVFALKIGQPTRSKLVCTLRNKVGTVVLEAAIASQHDLTKGMFVVQKGSFDFYDPETGRIYSDIFSSLNYGNGLNIDHYDHLYVASLNGKFYLMIQTSTENRDHLFVADGVTLNKEGSATVSATLAAFVPLNEQQAIVSFDGAHRMDLSSFSTTKLMNSYFWAIYNGLVTNGKLLANITYEDLTKVRYYDVDALLRAGEDQMPEATELDIWQNSKMNFVKTGNGSVYTLGCSEDGESYYIAKIGSDFSVEKTPLPFALAKYSYKDSKFYATGLSPTPSGDALYVPSGDQSIYKYVPGDAASLRVPFIAAPTGEWKIYGSGVNVNPVNGELWVCYMDGDAGKIVVYNVSGKEIKSIDCGDSVPQAVLFNR